MLPRKLKKAWKCWKMLPRLGRYQKRRFCQLFLWLRRQNLIPPGFSIPLVDQSLQGGHGCLFSLLRLIWISYYSIFRFCFSPFWCFIISFSFYFFLSQLQKQLKGGGYFPLTAVQRFDASVSIFSLLFFQFIVTKSIW